MRKLNGMVRHAIVKAAQEDLATLSLLGVNNLLDAANALAKAVAPVDAVTEVQ